MVDAFGWRAVFIINVPVVVLACVLTVRGVAADGGERRIELNPISQVCATLVLVTVTVAVVDINRLRDLPVGWIAMVVVLVVGTIGFVISERRASHPLLPPTVLRHSSTVMATVGAFAMGYALFGILFIYSLYFQTVWGESAAAAGLRYLPLVLVFVLVGPIAGRIGVSKKPFPFTAIGLILLTLAMGVLALLPSDVSYVAIAAAFVAIGLGYGLLSTTLAIVAVDTIPQELQGLGSSVNNTARQFGGVIGVAVAGNLFDTATDLPNPMTSANLVAAVLTLFAAVTAAIIMVRHLLPLTVRGKEYSND